MGPWPFILVDHNVFETVSSLIQSGRPTAAGSEFVFAAVTVNGVNFDSDPDSTAFFSAKYNFCDYHTVTDALAATAGWPVCIGSQARHRSVSKVGVANAAMACLSFNGSFGQK